MDEKKIFFKRKGRGTKIWQQGTQQPNEMCEPMMVLVGVGEEKNIKRHSWDSWRNLNIAWMLHTILELLLIFLGIMIVAPWLYIGESPY